MKVSLFCLIWIAVIATMGTAQSKWTLDSAHSTVGFEAEHIIVMPGEQKENPQEYYTMGATRGKFKEFSVQFTQDGPDFADSRIEATIVVNSIDTDNVPRDEHLKSKDFFYNEKYPAITFKSHEIKKIAEDNYKIIGELTIRGTRRTVELNAETNHIMVSAGGNRYISFSVSGLINRLDYGLQWSEMIENGAFRVSNYVKLIIQANFVEEKKS